MDKFLLQVNICEHKKEIIDDIVDFLSNHNICKILNTRINDYYKRTEISFLVNKDNIFNLCEKIINKCKEHNLDITKYDSEHPYIGIIDNIIITPMDNSSFDLTKEYCYKLGGYIVNQFNIPVIYYGLAAKKDGNINLSNFREHTFEGLKIKYYNSEFLPDEFNDNLNFQLGFLSITTHPLYIKFICTFNTNNISVAKDICNKLFSHKSEEEGDSYSTLFLVQPYKKTFDDKAKIYAILLNPNELDFVEFVKELSHQTSLLNYEIINIEIDSLMLKRDFLKLSQSINNNETKLENLENNNIDYEKVWAKVKECYKLTNKSLKDILIDA